MVSFLFVILYKCENNVYTYKKRQSMNYKTDNPFGRKLKVLVVPSDRTGVGYFRSTNPHIALQRNYPDDFHVDIEYEPKLNDLEWLKQYDIIHYHRGLGASDKMLDLTNRLEELGILTFMDVDDHWAPGMHHPAYHIIKNGGLDKQIASNIKNSKNITTTTPIFAKEMGVMNDNIFVLPNAINPEDKQFTSNPEKSDRIRIGWLGGSCMTPDTEILTDEGWKRFDELDQTEFVATLNPNSNTLEYNKPTGYICEPFDGELNCAKNGLIEYEVTPNHNMFASTVKSLTHKKLDLKLVQSKDIHGKNFHVKRDAHWVADEVDVMVIPKLIFEEELVEADANEYTNMTKKPTKYKTMMMEKYGDDLELDMDKWLEFFGFWMAEGWTTKTNNLYQVGIAQSKDNDYLETQFTLLTELGFKPTYTKDGKQIRVFNRQLWSYLRQFGNSYEKYVPTEVLDLPPRQLNLFLGWFIKGDGYIEKNTYGRMRGWTSSLELAGNLQEIALKIGITATITNRGKKTTEIKGRKITNQHDSYQINFGKNPLTSKHNKSVPLVRASDQYTKKYKGNVYCVEVENHIIYVRRNGKAFWIGNSHLHDLKLLKGMVSKLKSDKLLDKIQFVLCGYDLRGSVTEINQQTGQQTQRPIKPQESVWYEYEKIMTNNFDIVSPEYKAYLHKFDKTEYENVANEPYRRVWTKPIQSYASNYNKFDISLAPLETNLFNKVKSQLKVIEAGFHKKALVAQDYGPYTIDLKNAKISGGGFDDSANALLVDNNRNHKEWYQHLKYLILNPEKIEILGNNLYNTVRDTYSIDSVCVTRRELYLKELIKLRAVGETIKV
tara:strand:+ start:6496 stop:8991 length:2496 start_codon:yes stop_codon:yes gene_type:complete